MDSEHEALIVNARAMRALLHLVDDCRCSGWCHHLHTARRIIRESCARLDAAGVPSTPAPRALPAPGRTDPPPPLALHTRGPG